MITTISVEGPPFINIEPKDTVGITGSDILVSFFRSSAKLLLLRIYVHVYRYILIVKT